MQGVYITSTVKLTVFISFAGKTYLAYVPTYLAHGWANFDIEQLDFDNPDF